VSEKRVFSGRMSHGGELKKVDLVIDIKDHVIGEIYCVPANDRLWQRKSGQTERLWSTGVMLLEGVSIGSEGGVLAKRHYMEIEIVYGGNHDKVRVFMPLSEATSAATYLEPAAAANRNRRSRETMVRLYWELLEKEFQAASVIDLNEYARKNAGILDDFTHDLGSYADDGGAAAARMSDEEKHRLRLSALVWKLRDSISSGKLNGVLSEEASEYRDRAYIVQQQRVVSVSVNFNDLVSQLGNKGIVLQGVQCPACGGTTSEVPTGSYFTCQYCKATVKATDIFEKFKGVLGGG